MSTTKLRDTAVLTYEDPGAPDSRTRVQPTVSHTPDTPSVAPPQRDTSTTNTSRTTAPPNTSPDSTEATFPAPRARVLAMPEYHPPLADRNALRLDFNENTFGPSPRVAERLATLTPESLTIYPERGHVERIVGPHFGLTPEQVLLTNGVDEAIHLLACTFLDEGDQAIVATPSFFIYDVSVGLMSSNLVRVQADDTLAFPFSRVLAAITPATKLVFLATPNNPTGATIPREQIFAIAARAPQAVIFVDEAYFHFYGETVLSDLARHPNLIVGRTFSKAYGLANLRLGMLAGAPTLMRYLRKVSSPYNVNGIALELLPHALADEDHLAWYIEQVRVGRDRIIAALRELRVHHWPSAANFVLFRIGPRHAEFVRHMRTHGVLVRDRSADPGCDGCVRITVGVHDQVTTALTALRQVLQEMQ